MNGRWRALIKGQHSMYPMKLSVSKPLSAMSRSSKIPITTAVPLMASTNYRSISEWEAIWSLSARRFGVEALITCRPTADAIGASEIKPPVKACTWLKSGWNRSRSPRRRSVPLSGSGASES